MTPVNKKGRRNRPIDRKDNKKNNFVPPVPRTAVASGQMALQSPAARCSHQRATCITLPAVSEEQQAFRVPAEISPPNNRNPVQNLKRSSIDPNGIIVRNKQKPSGAPRLDPGRLAAELRECQAQVQLSSIDDMHAKNNDCELLQANIRSLEATNAKLERTVVKIQQQLCEKRAGLDGSYVDGSQSPFLLESAAKDSFSTISTFTNMYAKYKRLDGTLPARSLLGICLPYLNSVNPYITRDHHWIMLLKSVICHCLFQNFENETFIPFAAHRNTALYLNNAERVRRCFKYFEGSSNDSKAARSTCHAEHDNLKFDSLWSEYLSKTSSAILAPEILGLVQLLMEDGECTKSVDGENFKCACSNRPANSVNLVKSFILAARKVWDFHKLCLSFEPRATILRVAVEDPFNGEYMDSIVSLEDDDKFLPRVGFMIYPGFRLRKTVIKCQVYLGV